MVEALGVEVGPPVRSYGVPENEALQAGLQASCSGCTLRRHAFNPKRVRFNFFAMKSPRFCVSLLLVLALGHRAAAQAQTKALGAYLTVPIEFPLIDTGALNAQLAAAGLPACRYPVAAPGIGLQFQGGRFIMLFSFNKYTRQPDADTVALAVEYRATTLGVGYDLLPRPDVALYPYLGFKGSGINYLYNEKTPTATTFGNYLHTPLNHKEITNSRAHLDLGAGFSYQSFVMLNLRAGVLLPLEAARWNVNNNKLSLSDSPAVRYPGYITLTIGLGSMVVGDDFTKK
jgi:hypothetical protein